MTRALLTTLALSATLTTLSFWANLTVHTTTGVAHVLTDFSRLAAVAAWLILAMLWCTKLAVEENRCVETHLDDAIEDVRIEVRERLDAVEDVIGDIDKERVRANAAVVQLFRNKSAR